MIKLNSLQTRKLIDSHPFTYTEDFKKLQVTNDIDSLQKNQINQGQNQIDHKINIYKSYYQRSLIVIKRNLLKFIYKKRKINKHYRENIDKLIKVQAYSRGRIVRKKIQLDSILEKKRFLRKSKYAVTIQKHFRGYRLRKKYKQLTSNLKYDMEELEEFNDDFFNQPIQFNYQLKIPNGMNLAQIFQMNEQTNKNIQKQSKNQEQQQSKSQEQFKQNSSNLSQQEEKVQQLRNSKFSHQSEQINKKQTSQQIKKEELIKEWGCNNEKLAQTLQYRMQKNQQRKEQSQKKQLSATERYQLFLKNKK